MIIYVQIDWIRHGYSCANLEMDKGIVQHLITSKLLWDPVLTNYGIQQAKNLGEFMKKSNINYDIVACSNLRRAVETALYIFNKVYVVPYISEKRKLIMDKENESFGLTNLRTYITNNLQNYGLPDINYDLMGKPDNVITQTEFNYDKFISYTLEGLLNQLSKDKLTNATQNNPIRIAIVSHNDAIREHFEKQHSVKLLRYDNTEIWSENIKLVLTMVNDKINSVIVDNPFSKLSDNQQEISFEDKKGIIRQVYKPINTLDKNNGTDNKCTNDITYLKEKHIMKGGHNEYHDKYIRYKLRYMQSK